jgi:hypothetical protein
MIHDSIYYIVCCNVSCKESGNIKKNFNKCPECNKSLTQLTSHVLNKYFCTTGISCNSSCYLLHPTKKHQSPPYISPCKFGSKCDKKECLFLHPESKSKAWLS